MALAGIHWTDRIDLLANLATSYQKVGKGKKSRAYFELALSELEDGARRNCERNYAGNGRRGGGIGSDGGTGGDRRDDNDDDDEEDDDDGDGDGLAPDVGRGGGGRRVAPPAAAAAAEAATSGSLIAHLLRRSGGRRGGGRGEGTNNDDGDIGNAAGGCGHGDGVYDSVRGRHSFVLRHALGLVLCQEGRHDEAADLFVRLIDEWKSRPSLSLSLSSSSRSNRCAAITDHGCKEAMPIMQLLLDLRYALQLRTRRDYQDVERDLELNEAAEW